MAPEIVVDSFAGGGGASAGIEMALKSMAASGMALDSTDVNVAINHNGAALAMHCANHPSTVHMEADIWTVDPLATTQGRPVGLFWASPDCRHFSKAKGGAPVSDSVRGLAMVIAHWAEQVLPRMIFLENVEEFQEWGPTIVGPKGHLIADPDRKGETFALWVGKFRKLGYRVECKQLRACDYGAPTIRKRLYVIMRRDGRKIVWPKPTHGDPTSPAVREGKRLPWKTAAEIIDWDKPCHSVLMNRAEAREYTKATGFKVNRPLAENTMARIAAGVKRYVLEAAKPFVVTCNHTGGFRGQGLDDPFRTVTGAADAHGLVMPMISAYYGSDQDTPVTEPLHTVTTKDRFAVAQAEVVPFVTTYYGAKDGVNNRASPVDEPLRTITTEPRHGLVEATVVPHIMTMRNSGKPFTGADEPTHTVTAGGAGLSVVSAFLAQHNGNPRPEGEVPRPGRSIEEPLPTVTGAGAQAQVVHAFMTAHHTHDRHGVAVDVPLRAVTGIPKTDPVAVMSVLPPLTPNQEASARHVADFLRQYGAWDEREFVTVGDFVIVDIGMRMLRPRELARAQGFPDDYILAAPYRGGVLSESDQRHKIGNSVCPPVAAALVGANYVPETREPVRADQGWLFEGEAA